MKGVTSHTIAKHVRHRRWRLWRREDGVPALRARLRPGDVFLTLGAGDVWKVGEELLRPTGSLAEALRAAVPTLDGRVHADEPLARHSTWGIGGVATAVVEVVSVDELAGVDAWCRAHDAPLLILGWGSNVLFPDEGWPGVAVRLLGDFEEITIDGVRVRVGAGVFLPKLARRCVQCCHLVISGVDCRLTGGRLPKRVEEKPRRNPRGGVRRRHGTTARPSRIAVEEVSGKTWEAGNGASTGGPPSATLLLLCYAPSSATLLLLCYAPSRRTPLNRACGANKTLHVRRGHGATAQR